MFCPNCGNQLEDSAKFCAACGTQVGEVNPGAPVATAAPAAPAAPGLGAKLKETLQGYWKSPKEAAATVAADGNFAIAGIFAGINALAVFFFLWRTIGLLLSMIADSTGAKVSDMEEYLEYPIFPMLLAGIVIAALGIAATAFVVFIAAKINKQDADLKKLLLAHSVHSLFPTALLLVGIVLGLLAWWLQFAVLTLVMVLWFVNVCTELQETAGVKAMESGKALVINALVIFAVYVVAVYAMSWIGTWSIGELSINNITLNEMVEKAGGVLDMLGDIA